MLTVTTLDLQNGKIYEHYQIAKWLLPVACVPLGFGIYGSSNHKLGWVPKHFQ